MTRGFVERLRALARASGLLQWRTSADLVAFQEERLRDLILHAYTNVPYYREMFGRHGVTPAQVRTLADLHRIPISSKSDLRRQPADRIVAAGNDLSRLHRIQTSGSSGEPLVLYRTARERRRQQLFWLRAQRALGQRFGDRVVWVSAVRSGPATKHKTFDNLIRAAGLQNYALDVRTPPELLLRQLAQLRPAIIVGYPSMLARLGEELQRGDCAPVRPRFVMSGGEGLTGSRRVQIEAAWGVPVFEVYSCWETSLIAWQCLETGLLHVCDDSVLLEVVRDGRAVAPGERGEVVVTSFNRRAMPLIRYRLGDLVTRGAAACPCGQPFGTIGAVQGRMLDLFRLPGGRLLHPYEILSDLKEDAFRWLRHYQLIQEAEDRLLFLMVPGPEFTRERLAEFERRAAQVLGNGAWLRTEFVDRIEPGPGGKFHLARSLLPRADGETAWHRSEPIARSYTW